MAKALAKLAQLAGGGAGKAEEKYNGGIKPKAYRPQKYQCLICMIR